MLLEFDIIENNDAIIILINRKQKEISDEEEKLKYVYGINEYTDISIKVRENNSEYLNSDSKCIQQYAKLIKELIILENKRDYEIKHKIMSEMSVVDVKFEIDSTIEKLNNKIEILEKKISDQENFINEHIELRVNDSPKTILQMNKLNNEKLPVNKLYNEKLPYICETVTLFNILSVKNGDTVKCNTKRFFALPIYSNDKLNSNFKLIKCKILILFAISHDINYENLPESTEEIVLYRMDSRTNTSMKCMENFTQNIAKAKLPNLKRLNFTECNDLTKIYYELLLPLSIKIVKMDNCPKFEEKHLLIKNGIEIIEL